MIPAARASVVPRSFVLVAATVGLVAGSFCAPPPSPITGLPRETGSAGPSTSMGGAAPEPPPASSTTVSASASSSSAPKRPPPPSTSAAAAPPLPKPSVTFPKKPVPIAPTHGGESWAVFLVVGPSTPERNALADAWWPTQKNISRGLGCHVGQGAPADDEMYVAVYFETEKDAQTFAKGTTPPPVRIAKLKTYCLD